VTSNGALEGATTGPIGLLGGTFDPIHVAHLQLARTAIAHLGLAQVRFLPAGQPWQKPDVSPAAARADMVELALHGESRMSIDRREIDRPGPTYTIDTLRELRAELGADVALVLLLGDDQLQRFDSWREWRAIIELTHLGVAARPGDAAMADAGHGELADWLRAHRAPPGSAPRAAGGSIFRIPMAPIDCSATEIRHLVRAAATPQELDRLARLLPAAVLDYIRLHRLYGTDPAPASPG